MLSFNFSFHELFETYFEMVEYYLKEKQNYKTYENMENSDFTQ